MHAVELAHQPQPELAKQAPQVGRVSQESAATVAQMAWRHTAFLRRLGWGWPHFLRPLVLPQH